MASSDMTDNFKIAESKPEPWPAVATLYQPYETEQILLPENSSCLAVQTYFRMCQLQVGLRFVGNAKFMSPGGRLTKLPFLRVDDFVVAEFEPIVRFIEKHKLHIGQWMDEDTEADMWVLVTVVENIFTMAELYVSYNINEVYDQVTAPRTATVFPWWLSIWQNFVQRRNARHVLKVYQWDDMTIDDVVEEVNKCCEMLTTKLEAAKAPFFYSRKPCALDAIVFGHIFSILTTNLPNNVLAKTVNNFKSLVGFCRYINKNFFDMCRYDLSE